MADCCCGNLEGTNAECERCRLIARIRTLEAEFEAEKARQLAALKEWESKHNGR